MFCLCRQVRLPRRTTTKASKPSPTCSKANCAVYYSNELEKRVLVRQGEQAFVAVDVPHTPRNERGKPCTWIVVHSSGSDQDGMVLLPELDAKLAQRMAATA